MIFLIVACTGLSAAQAVDVEYTFSPLTLVVDTGAPTFDLEIPNSSEYEINNIVTTDIVISVAPEGSEGYTDLSGTFSDSDPEINPNGTLVLKFDRDDLFNREVNGKTFEQYLIEDVCADSRSGTVTVKIEGAYSGNPDGFVGYDPVVVIQNKQLPDSGGPKK